LPAQWSLRCRKCIEMPSNNTKSFSHFWLHTQISAILIVLRFVVPCVLQYSQLMFIR
jgi:hypothetical protein